MRSDPFHDKRRRHGHILALYVRADEIDLPDALDLPFVSADRKLAKANPLRARLLAEVRSRPCGGRRFLRGEIRRQREPSNDLIT